MRSLKRTIVASLLGVLSALAVVGGASAYLSAMSETDELLDLQQMQIARFVGDLSQENGPDLALAPHDAEDDYVVTVRQPSTGLERSSSPRPVLPEPAGTGFTDFDDGGTAWRVYTLMDGDRTVQVAQQAVVRQELAQETALRATLPFILALPLVALVSELVVRIAFRRMDRLSTAVAHRDDRDLSTLPVDDVPAEVRPLVLGLNDLLTRLQHSVDRERRFLADAAHELRTPLAALAIQVANLRGKASGSAWTERLDDVENGVRRASTVADQLLRLARIEGTGDGADDEDVRLDQIVLDVVGALVPLAERRKIDLGLVANDAASLRGSAAELRALVEALIDNALRYVPAGGTVDVALRRNASGVVLTVVDDGPGVPDSALPRLRERFFRVSSATTIKGSGLGLAIADAIARKHGGELRLANRAERSGFNASFVVPMVGDAGPGEVREPIF
ncbi:ATP-binding protein [uncultured Aureimonas sp.]|uniref:ATP-binding protein n=1 Tax=uncultured Aureimonas sp. TaxID=1604662 RepID=UPI0025D66208|nr:ATP-binding protein [uncultured Aureimonas sp.]